MILNILIAVFGLAGFFLLIAAVGRLRRRYVSGAVVSGLSSLALFLLAACAVLLSLNLRTYQRLTAEQPAGELQFSRIGPHQYNGALTYRSGQVAIFFLRGDEWQVDARLIKWRPAANLLGFDTVYRLERISGRYTDIEDEKTQPRTVYELNAPGSVDLWDLIHRFRAQLPWFDAMYGSATFLPMADGGLYEIKISQSGLLARPLNQAARDAVGSWH
jgi:hypothetical protein